jgi:hypothetical protein
VQIAVPGNGNRPHVLAWFFSSSFFYPWLSIGSNVLTEPYNIVFESVGAIVAMPAVLKNPYGQPGDLPI